MTSADPGDAPELTETVGVSSDASVGPFDYCPRLGFREYWYPAVLARSVKSRPVRLTMLGEDLVFFRGGDGKVAALSDWCPHRGARLSMGRCEYNGTVTCPYHGYTFDASGQCVAGLIEHPNSHFVTKLRARKFATAERLGIVFVWMGETAPVEVEQDIPRDILDASFTGSRFLRVKVWGANWTEPVAQGIDFHEFYLHHPRPSFWRIVNIRLPFFRPRVTYTGGVRIVSTGPDHVAARMADEHREQAYYPGLNAKWPRQTSLWILPWDGHRGTPGVGEPLFDWDHNAELPSKIRTIIGQSIHLRWMVPITEDTTRVWTFTLVRAPKTWARKIWLLLWYHCYRKPAILIDTNEKEDLVVFARGNLDLERPQKLGPLDAALLYFRRNLALKSRDFERLGRSEGCLKPPPTAAVHNVSAPADGTAATGPRVRSSES